MPGGGHCAAERSLGSRAGRRLAKRGHVCADSRAGLAGQQHCAMMCGEAMLVVSRRGHVAGQWHRVRVGRVVVRFFGSPDVEEIHAAVLCELLPWC